MSQMKIRTYDELSQLKTIEERFEYLKIGNKIGAETFGFDRYLNQKFYRSPEWKATRREVIIRDNGNDLGVDGYEIKGPLVIHHMNPITIDDILKRQPELFDPAFLICASWQTHQAIHYGDSSLLPKLPIERRPGDTKLW